MHICLIIFWNNSLTSVEASRFSNSLGSYRSIGFAMLEPCMSSSSLSSLSEGSLPIPIDFSKPTSLLEYLVGLKHITLCSYFASINTTITQQRNMFQENSTKLTSLVAHYCWLSLNISNKLQFASRLPPEFVLAATRRVGRQRGRAVTRHAFPGPPGTRGPVAHRALDFFSITHHNHLVEFTKRCDVTRSLVFFVAAVLDVHDRCRGTSICTLFDNRPQSLYDDEC